MGFDEVTSRGASPRVFIAKIFGRSISVVRMVLGRRRTDDEIRNRSVVSELTGTYYGNHFHVSGGGYPYAFGIHS